MTSFTYVKMATAFLTTIFVLMSLSMISDTLFYSPAPAKPGYAIAASDQADTKSEEAKPAGLAYDPIEGLLASADMAAGQKVFKKCAACHTVESGGKHKAGPNLWNIVGRAMASADDFKYSGPISEFGAGKNWDYEALNGFLFKPKTYIKGNKMGFVGLKKTADRANLILYLRSLSASPMALPGS